MEATIKDGATDQAHKLQISFKRGAELLRMIYNEQLAIEHYEPEIIMKLIPEIAAISYKVSCRHFSHHGAPLRYRIFHHTEMSDNAEFAIAVGFGQVIRQLKEFHAGKERDEQVNADLFYRIRVYCECATFLSKVCEERIAITDYIPKIKIGENEKTGIKYFSVEYRHKYFLFQKNQQQVFKCESAPDNTSDSLQAMVDDVIAQLRVFHLLKA